MADIFELFRRIANKDDSPALPITHLIVGLGNPGRDYAFTRHNTGFLALDYLAQKLGVRVERAKFKSLVGEATVEGNRCLLMQPQTYMNNSGEAVSEAARFYKIAPENILVIFDDASLPVGKLRLRKSGSAGGHNGLKSIIYHLNSDAFPRVKIGIGEKPHPDMDLADWVLSPFSKEEQKVLFDEFGKTEQAIKLILADRFDEAMNRFN